MNTGHLLNRYIELVKERHKLLEGRIAIEKNPEQKEAYEVDLKHYTTILEYVSVWEKYL